MRAPHHDLQRVRGAAAVSVPQNLAPFPDFGGAQQHQWIPVAIENQEAPWQSHKPGDPQPATSPHHGGGASKSSDMDTAEAPITVNDDCHDSQPQPPPQQ